MTFYGRINRNSLVTQAFTVQRVTVDITNNLSALSVVLSYSSRQDYLLDSFLRSIGGGESWDWNYRRRRRMLQRNHVDHRDPLEKKIAKNCVFFFVAWWQNPAQLECNCLVFCSPSTDCVVQSPEIWSEMLIVEPLFCTVKVRLRESKYKFAAVEHLPAPLSLPVNVRSPEQYVKPEGGPQTEPYSFN